jgi:hypothetical protein
VADRLGIAEVSKKPKHQDHRQYPTGKNPGGGYGEVVSDVVDDDPVLVPTPQEGCKNSHQYREPRHTDKRLPKCDLILTSHGNLNSVLRSDVVRQRLVLPKFSGCILHSTLNEFRQPVGLHVALSPRRGALFGKFKIVFDVVRRDFMHFVAGIAIYLGGNVFKIIVVTNAAAFDGA